MAALKEINFRELYHRTCLFIDRIGRNLAVMKRAEFPVRPDDNAILVYFVGESEKAEGIWCRVERVDHDKGLIFANLLNQPYRSYGYNMGDTVPIGLIKMEDGELKAAAIL